MIMLVMIVFTFLTLFRLVVHFGTPLRNVINKIVKSTRVTLPSVTEDLSEVLNKSLSPN